MSDTPNPTQPTTPEPHEPRPPEETEPANSNGGKPWAQERFDTSYPNSARDADSKPADQTSEQANQ